MSIDNSEIDIIPCRQGFIGIGTIQDFSERGPVQVMKKVALLKSLKDRNDIYEWVLGSHFGSLIDLEQEMGQWSLMLRSGTLTSVITSGLFVYIWSIRVADVCVILVGDFTSWVKPSSVIVESQEECGFSKSILKSPSTRISAWGLTVWMLSIICTKLSNHS